MSYQLMGLFTPEFFFNEGEPYDISDTSDRPTSVWQAIISMNEEEWNDLAKEVFHVDPRFLTPEAVLEKIEETDSVTDLRSPVEVWIDKEGWHTVKVYDRKDNPKRSRNRAKKRTSRRRNAPKGWKPIGVIGDRNPIEHWGGIVYQTPYGFQMIYFQESEGTVWAHTVDVGEDPMADLDWVDWNAVAEYTGASLDEIREASKSEKYPLARAQVVEAAASYVGWSELDWSPETLTLAKAERKFGKDVDRAHAYESKQRKKNVEDNPRCGAGEIKIDRKGYTRKGYKRKGYTRKDGTRVKASKVGKSRVPRSKFCVKDQGKPGRTSRGAEKGPHAKEKPWIEEEGSLGGPGYTKKSTKARHAILDRCVGRESYRQCLGKIMVLLRSSELHASTRKKLQADKSYLVKKYGGPGSFGPRKRNAEATERVWIYYEPKRVKVSDDRGHVKGALVVIQFENGVRVSGTVIPPEGDSVYAWADRRLIGPMLHDQEILDAVAEAALEGSYGRGGVITLDTPFMENPSSRKRNPDDGETSRVSRLAARLANP